jgi:hypothetical protein
MLRPSRKEEKTIVKISKSKMKQADRFTNLESKREKNCKIQNERIWQASKFYHLIKSISRDTDKKYKTTIHIVYFQKPLLYGAKTWAGTNR